MFRLCGWLHPFGRNNMDLDRMIWISDFISYSSFRIGCQVAGKGCSRFHDG